MADRSPAEWREHLGAFGRFVLLALQPWSSRWPRVTEFVIALAGAALGIVVGFAEHSPLLGGVIFLAVTVALLLIAGMRIERELRGDSGIRLEPNVNGRLFRLGVTNNSGAWADFRADAIAVHPEPAHVLSQLPWAIPWTASPGRDEKIGPHGIEHLCLASALVTRATDGGPLSRRAWLLTASGVKLEVGAESPITITVEVRRLGSTRRSKGVFKLWLDNEGYPRITQEPV